MMIGPVVPAAVALEVRSAGCAQAARQQSIPAPTGTAWYAARLGLDHVAGLSLGEGQLVAVVDTGVAPVPALAGALRPGIDLQPAAPQPAAPQPAAPQPAAPQPTAPQPAAPQPAAPQPAAPAASTSTSTATDCDGRGTVMAGLVAARRGDSAAGPGSELPGLARAAEILPVRVLASAREAVDPVLLASGMTKAVAAGASVLLVGPAGRDDPALRAATQAALDAGIPVVAAAGDGDGESLAFPAAYDGVIAVAATGPQDAVSAVNAFGRVSVGAPGTDIVGLGLDGGVVGGEAGSALAAALVAAAVADVRSALPDLTPEQLLDRVRDTADRPGVAIPDPALGWGVVNPVTALTAPLDNNLPPSAVPRATDPPVTDPPVTDPPVTDPPVTDPPVTDPPVPAHHRKRDPAFAENELPAPAQIGGPPARLISNRR